MARKVRLGGEFYRSVKRREPSGIIEKMRAELRGDAYRVDYPTEVKRELFLLEVEKLEGGAAELFGIGVLGSLQRDVMPFYVTDDYPGYRAALNEWQAHWKLTTTAFHNAIERPNAPWLRDMGCWMRRAATSTLEGWAEGATESGYYRGHLPLEWQMWLAEPTPPSRESQIALAYDPLTTNRAEVEAKLTAILDARDARVRAAGAVRTKEVRQSRQFVWLARSRVLSQSDAEILEAENDVDLLIDAVRKSRERLASEIGL